MILKKEEEEPQDLLSQLKRHSAIGKEEIKVDGRTKEAKDIPAEIAPDVYGVPFLNRIKESNIRYAGGK